MYKLLLFFPLFAPVQTYVRAIPHNSKCRYGERGAADAKPKAQIILDCLIEHFGNADAVPQLPERCLSRKAGIVWCRLNAFAAKSALSAFPFPGKIHPILPAFLITRTSSGTAQKPGDFFSLPAGTAVRFSSSGRTCLPSICRTQSSCKAFTPRIPTSASAPLWTCCCQKIRSMQFYSSFASLPSAFFLHSLQNRKRTFIISATRGSCQKNCQRDTNRL